MKQEMCVLLCDRTVTACSPENADNFLHEDKLAIVHPAESQFYVFTSPSIPAALSKSEGLLSARKTQADGALWSIITA